MEDAVGTPDMTDAGVAQYRLRIIGEYCMSNTAMDFRCTRPSQLFSSNRQGAGSAGYIVDNDYGAAV